MVKKFKTTSNSHMSNRNPLMPAKYSKTLKPSNPNTTSSLTNLKPSNNNKKLKRKKPRKNKKPHPNPSPQKNTSNPKAKKSHSKKAGPTKN
jgi:hypothetical protein